MIGTPITRGSCPLLSFAICSRDGFISFPMIFTLKWNVSNLTEIRTWLSNFYIPCCYPLSYLHVHFYTNILSINNFSIFLSYCVALFFSVELFVLKLQILIMVSLLFSYGRWNIHGQRNCWQFFTNSLSMSVFLDYDDIFSSFGKFKILKSLYLRLEPKSIEPWDRQNNMANKNSTLYILLDVSACFRISVPFISQRVKLISF